MKDFFIDLLYTLSLVYLFPQQDKIYLQINVENVEVKRWVESHLRPLQEQMAKGGIAVEKMEVSVDDHRSDYKNQEDKVPYHEKSTEIRNFGELSKSKGDGFVEEVVPARLLRRDFGYNSMEIWA